MAAHLHSRITGKLFFFVFNALLIICMLSTSISPVFAENGVIPTPDGGLATETATITETPPTLATPMGIDTPATEPTPIPTESPTFEIPTEIPTIENTLPEISAESGPNILYVAPSTNCGGQIPCYATIQEAVDDSTGGDTVKVAEGTYTSPSFEIVYLNKAITLTGGFAVSDWTSSDPTNHPSILNAQNQLGTRAITIDGTAFTDLITVEGFTFTNGYLLKDKSGAGVEIYGGRVLLQNNTITKNIVKDDTGHISGYGAGVDVKGGVVTIKNNQITMNNTISGGGIYIVNGTVTIEGNTISGNYTYWGCGGGITILNGNVNINNNLIKENNDLHSGGGICLRGGAGTIQNNTFKSNVSASYNGAGIFVDSGTYEIKQNSFMTNSANNFGMGGGIYVGSSAIGTKITNNTFTGNNANYQGGGAIAVFGHQTNITGNIFINNSVVGSGGAIYIMGASSTTIDRNLIIGNSASTHGGAIHMSSANDTHGQNNIVAQNSSPMEAVYVTNSSNVTMNHWTIADNGKYGVVSDETSLNFAINNCILSGHTVAGLYGPKITSTNSLFFNNLNRCSGGAVCNSNVIGNPNYFDPANEDYHITAGSAALDAGINVGVSIDIDGESRPKGAGYDIGADELIEPPTAGFTNTEESWIGPAIVFSNTTVVEGNTTYLWDFGDGTTSTQVNPSHRYSLPGTYTVSLTATNLGGSDSTSGLVTIQNYADFSTSTPDWLGETTSFTNATISSGETTYSWDFGDGTYSSEENPTHIFSAAGTYQVSLVATNAEGSGTKTVQVTIYSSPLPSFSTSSPDWLGQTTTIIGSAVTSPAGDTSFTSTWDFGDGTTSSADLSPEHFYSTPGTYQVSLTVANAAGSNSIQKEVVIQAPEIQFSSATYKSSEGAGEGLVIVNLDRPSESTVTFNYSTTNETALAGEDYIASSGTLSIDPGQVSKTFIVPIIEDNISETGETVQLSISSPVNAVLGTISGSILTIQDNDPPSITYIDPNSAIVGSSEIILNINGSGFLQDISTAQWNGFDLPTTYIDKNNLTAQISSELLNGIGFAKVIVENPDPSGGVSNTFSFAINSDGINVCPESDIQDLNIDTAAGLVHLSMTGVSSCGTISIQALKNESIVAPAGFQVVPTSFEISESNTGLTNASVTVPFFSNEISTLNSPPESLRMLHFTNGQWEDVTTALDLQNHTITGKVDTFSPLIIGAYNIPDCAITINNQAVYTNDLTNLIFSNVQGAGNVMLSNDAGFIGATWKPYKSALQWTISDPGSRIVTLNVYARVRSASGTNLCSGLNLSDDIIYDPLPPTASFEYQTSAASLEMMFVEASGTIPVTVKVNSTDQVGGSGVGEMQISTSPTFTGAKWQSYEPTVVVQMLSGDVLYLRTRDRVGNVSKVYSSAMKLPGIPSLLLPSNGGLSNIYKPKLDWSNSSPSADNYELQVALTSSFDPLYLKLTDLKDSEFTFETDLPSNTTYYWRVRGLNTLGNSSSWSAVRTFRTALLAPILTAPANEEDLLVNRPTFTWEPVTGVTGYSIQISKNTSFTSLVGTYSVTSPTYTPTANLPANIPLYWRVQSKGTNGPSAWSEVWSLNIKN